MSFGVWEMSFAIWEMSFVIWEMSFAIFWEMSFAQNAQKCSVSGSQLGSTAIKTDHYDIQQHFVG